VNAVQEASSGALNDEVHLAISLVESAERELNRIRTTSVMIADFLLGNVVHNVDFRALDALKRDLDAHSRAELDTMLWRYGEQVSLGLARDRLVSLLRELAPFRKVRP
jgi:hypothetical protein